MTKLLVLLVFAVYLSADFTSGSSIYRQPEDKSSMRNRQNDGDGKAMSNLDKYDEKSDDQKKDSLVNRFIDTVEKRVNTAHKLWNEAQRDSNLEKDSSEDSSLAKADQSDEAKMSTLVGSFLEGLKASTTNARRYVNNKATDMD